MKKLILPIAVLFLCASQAIAGVNIKKTNGGSLGYKTVDENHDNGNHRLKCDDPGLSKCEWVHKPLVLGYTVNVDDIDMGVAGEVSTGVMSGSGSAEGGVTYTWTATSTTDYELLISGDFTIEE